MVGDAPGDMGRLMRLAGWVDLDSEITVCWPRRHGFVYTEAFQLGCAGAVMEYLGRRRSVDYLPNDEEALVAFRIRAIETFALSDMMYVNADTLASLQIIQSERHPNSHMQGPSQAASGAKESLSVFGLFSRLAHTPQGKHKLRQIFLRPSLDLPAIKERLKTTRTLLQAENSPLLDKMVRGFKMIKDVRSVIVHLHKGTSGRGIRNGAWANLQNFTFHCLQVLEAVRELRGARDLVVTSKILEQIQSAHLTTIGTMIEEVVDFKQSIEQHRTVVKQGVNAELDNMKRTYDGLDSMLTQVATEISYTVPEWAAQYVSNCIFFPQLGFLTVVPLDQETGKGKYEGEGIENDVWERMFTSNDMGYYKNHKMKELDAFFGDIFGLICGRLERSETIAQANL
tara:strand:+ start:167 stop:1360 length:1194 start_codon:yes stop_codon:yes gene_type:complete